MADAAPLVAVTDHAVERFRQRVGSRRGELDARPEIGSRVARAWAAGRVGRAPESDPATVLVRDLVDRDVVFVCRLDRPRGELVVVTLWEEGRLGEPRVPREFTDALRRSAPRRGRGGAAG
jgi:hypothetical protein